MLTCFLQVSRFQTSIGPQALIVSSALSRASPQERFPSLFPWHILTLRARGRANHRRRVRRGLEMWSDQDLVEVLRSSVPYYLVVALPLLILLSPVPVDAAAEFTVYRLQQYDLHGTPHGKLRRPGCRATWWDVEIISILDADTVFWMWCERSPSKDFDLKSRPINFWLLSMRFHISRVSG